eukprot:360667-Chlamydomonas_euryale.AAC.8
MCTGAQPTNPYAHQRPQQRELPSAPIRNSDPSCRGVPSAAPTGAAAAAAVSHPAARRCEL